MFVLGYFLQGIAVVLNIVLYMYLLIVIARAVLSWVNSDPWNPLVRFLYLATEPLFERVRRPFPLHAGGIDFTPFVIMLAIIFLQNFLVNSLARVSHELLK